MKYTKVLIATFIDRPNRFIANVLLEGDSDPTTVHVKNTGRCKELLIPGTKVVLSDSMNPNRKTRYDLIGVYKEGTGYINMDSQAPNEVVKEWLTTGNNPIFKNITYIKPEYTFMDSRIDFYIEENDSKTLMEVKGVTLEIDGVGYFPDAPTERGVKHLNHLAEWARMGNKAYLAFVIQIPNVTFVHPNDRTHKEFGIALQAAIDSGVKVLYLGCHMTPEEIKIGDVYGPKQ